MLLRQFSNSEYRVVPCLLLLFRKDGFPSGSDVGKNDLNDACIVTVRQVTIDQIVQETVEISQLQYIVNMVNISVVGIVHVSRMRVVTKTDEIPQLQCIDEFINDSDVRAPQVLIVEKTVENSQLQ